jgi:hypothetical protein
MGLCAVPIMPVVMVYIIGRELHAGMVHQ